MCFQDERVEILKALSKPLTFSDDLDFRKIASECEYFTGADLKALLYNAQLLVAHRCINSKDSSEKNKGGALNGMTQNSNKMWFSSNVGDPEEKKGEISQKVRIYGLANTITIAFFYIVKNYSKK